MDHEIVFLQYDIGHVIFNVKGKRRQNREMAHSIAGMGEIIASFVDAFRLVNKSVSISSVQFPVISFPVS